MSHCRAGSFFAAILNYENTLGTRLLAALHFNEQYMSPPFAAKQMGNEQSFMKSVNARHRSRHGFHYETLNPTKKVVFFYPKKNIRIRKCSGFITS